MDSCHIFNFLFGTRKATSELRKCFTGSANKDKAQCNRNNSAYRKVSTIQPHESNKQHAIDEQNRHHQPPDSSSGKQQQVRLDLVTRNGAISSKTSCLKASIGAQEPNEQSALARNVIESRERTLLTTQVASGVFEAQLVQLDQCGDNAPPNNVVFNGQELSSLDQLDANNNEIKSAGSPLKVIFENPANKLDNLREPANLEKSNVEVKTSQKQQEQQRINVYDNPLNQGDTSAIRSEVTSASADEEGQQRPGETRRNNKSERVKNLVQSFEINNTMRTTTADNTNLTPRRLATKPPETPPKSTRAKCLNLQLIMRKPTNISSLFQDETFLARHFFDKLAPLDRCAAAQVCRKWRNILYANTSYWEDLMGVIDCTQLRREHLAECIMNTLQSAKLKHLQQQQQQRGGNLSQANVVPANCGPFAGQFNQLEQMQTGDLYENLGQLDQDEIWRIQELCNRYTMRAFSNGLAAGVGVNSAGQANQPQSYRTSAASFNATANQSDQSETNNNQTTTSTSGIANSKSSSSQISSSTLSSISISSLLSPLSESSRVDSIKEKLYTTLEERGFVSICLFGATDEDIEDLVGRTRPNGAQRRLRSARLNNCALSDRGLETLINSFGSIEELELMGCNEITNSIDLRPLSHLRRLIITDCINIADGLAQKLVEIMHQLETLVVQAYHLTDAFVEFISLNSDTSQLRRFELANCKEITNSTALTIAKHFPTVETLSISGSTKINDDGIELLAEHMKCVVSLDLGWLKIGDLSLECLACDLRHLRELVLDRNVHITDLGLGYLATMANLTLLYVRWCPQLTDKSIKSISNMRSLTSLSLAGLHQITARGILSLLESQQLEELELTNCPAVTCELQQFLSAKMPNCNIIY